MNLPVKPSFAFLTLEVSFTFVFQNLSFRRETLCLMWHRHDIMTMDRAFKAALFSVLLDRTQFDSYAKRMMIGIKEHTFTWRNEKKRKIIWFFPLQRWLSESGSKSKWQICPKDIYSMHSVPPPNRECPFFGTKRRHQFSYALILYSWQKSRLIIPQWCYAICIFVILPIFVIFSMCRKDSLPIQQDSFK